MSKQKTNRWLPRYFIILKERNEDESITIIITNDINSYPSEDEANAIVQKLIENKDYEADAIEIFKLYQKEDFLVNTPNNDEDNINHNVIA